MLFLLYFKRKKKIPLIEWTVVNTAESKQKKKTITTAATIAATAKQPQLGIRIKTNRYDIVI